MPAFVSCAQSQNVMPALGNRSEIGIIAEPMIPNACSMPCNCSTFTNASSVVILIYVILQLILPLSCGDHAPGRSTCGDRCHCWSCDSRELSASNGNRTEHADQRGED